MILVLPAVILLMVNSYTNRHNHLISGFLYTHAHPFDKRAHEDSGQNHGHSRLELVVLDLLTSINVVLTSAAVLSLFLLAFLDKILIRISCLNSRHHSNIPCPRGPPVCIF